MVASRIISRLNHSYGLGKFLGCDCCNDLFFFTIPFRKRRQVPRIDTHAKPQTRLQRIWNLHTIRLSKLPQTSSPPKGSSKPPEGALNVPTRCACRLALAVVTETELNNRLWCQASAGGGQSKARSNTLGRLAKLETV